NDSAQVRFVSKELAAQEFMAEAGEDFISFLGNNPLHDSFVIRLKPEYFSSEGTSGKLTNFKRVKEDLEKIPGVFEVSYAAEQVDEIEKNLDKITWFLLGFTVVLFFSIAVLLNNTIRLAMFSQRFLIRSMQLVGATAGFIRRPFLLRAVLQGLLSALFAFGLLVLLFPLLQSFGLGEVTGQFRSVGLLQDWLPIIGLGLILCLVGMLASFISAYFAVSRYLKMSADDLY
ncbi:MAG: ABC transporter permease, partial [Verrucomicrobia bacterium]|nr:ABC transporter permease [Cytophagales bacterium]